MKFQPDTSEGVNLITRHEGDRLWVGNLAHTRSVLVPLRGPVIDWNVDSLADFKAEHFERVAALQPEVVIFGSGSRLRFVSPVLLKCLMERRIGIETMDTPAACRTYNVLASEGRDVLAALLMERAPGPA